MDSELERTAAEALVQRKHAHLHRERRVVEHLSSEVEVLIGGRRYVNFSSNDYLGLRGHPKLREAIARATLKEGAGSGASALITGYSGTLASAERALADWKGTESAVLLPSGYQTNHAAVGALAGMAEAAGKSVRFLIDKLVHASLVDAVRASERSMRVFGHNDLEKLERLLEARTDSKQIDVVITESIFSMDGDAADLAGLAALRRKFGFALLVDEAAWQRRVWTGRQRICGGVGIDGGCGCVCGNAVKGTGDDRGGGVRLGEVVRVRGEFRTGVYLLDGGAACGGGWV